MQIAEILGLPPLVKVEESYPISPDVKMLVVRGLTENIKKGFESSRVLPKNKHRGHEEYFEEFRDGEWNYAIHSFFLDTSSLTLITRKSRKKFQQARIQLNENVDKTGLYYFESSIPTRKLLNNDNSLLALIFTIPLVSASLKYLKGKDKSR